jgi:hypothetical protein
MSFGRPGRIQCLQETARPLCLANAHVEMLAGIRARIYNFRDQQWIFWLGGIAGTGKSTIARTTARELHGRGHLGAGFFFPHCGGDVGRAELFVTNVVSQLAASEHLTVVCKQTLRASTSKAVSGSHEFVRKSRQDQREVPVIGPISQLKDHARTFRIAQACDPTRCDGRRRLKPGTGVPHPSVCDGLSK